MVDVPPIHSVTFVGCVLTLKSAIIVVRAVSLRIASQPLPEAVTKTLYQVIPAETLGGV